MRLAPLLLAAAAHVSPSAAPSPLTLVEAWQRAQSANAALGAAAARVSAQASAADAAARALWPRVSVSSSAQRTNNAALAFMARLNAAELAPADLEIERLVSPNAVSHLTTTTSIEMPIDVFGRLRRQRQLARAGAGAASEGLEEARLDLRFGVESAYWRAWLETRGLRAVERALAAARTRREVVGDTVSVGGALQADLLRARARERQRQAGVADRQAAANTAMAVLARWMGAREAAFSLSDDLPVAGLLEGELRERQSLARVARPLVRSAHERLRASGAAVRLERATGWPDLSAYAQAVDDRGAWDGGRRSYAAGLTLRWLPFDPTRGARRAQVEAERQAAERDVAAAEDQVSLEVAVAWAQATSARERQGAAQGGAEEGQEVLRVMRERRAAGLATLTDELETESAALFAELEELTATADVVLADAALRRALGVDGGDQP